MLLFFFLLGLFLNGGYWNICLQLCSLSVLHFLKLLREEHSTLRRRQVLFLYWLFPLDFLYSLKYSFLWNLLWMTYSRSFIFLLIERLFCVPLLLMFFSLYVYSRLLDYSAQLRLTFLYFNASCLSLAILCLQNCGIFEVFLWPFTRCPMLICNHRSIS